MSSLILSLLIVSLCGVFVEGYWYTKILLLIGSWLVWKKQWGRYALCLVGYLLLIGNVNKINLLKEVRPEMAIGPRVYNNRLRGQDQTEGSLTMYLHNRVSVYLSILSRSTTYFSVSKLFGTGWQNSSTLHSIMAPYGIGLLILIGYKFWTKDVEVATLIGLCISCLIISLVNHSPSRFLIEILGPWLVSLSLGKNKIPKRLWVLALGASFVLSIVQVIGYLAYV